MGSAGQGTVVLGVITHLVFTWMRKVVGSNPGKGNRLSFVVSKMECKDRMKGPNERTMVCGLRSSRNKRSFESIFFELEVAPSTICCCKHILMINL